MHLVDNMGRSFNIGENPNDVIKKINKFIDDEDNTDSIMGNIGDIMGSVDKLEMTVSNIEDDQYKNEMLGYITMIRRYTTSILDAFDSMMGM
jgi:hypothetical protein